jgi:hypothetical protein
VDSVGVRICMNVWMQSFLLLLKSSLCSSVSVLSNLLLSGVCYHRQTAEFSSFFNDLINIVKSCALSAYVCSGVSFQPAHCIVSLKNLAVSSTSSAVLNEIFKVNLSLLKSLKSSQFVSIT